MSLKDFKRAFAGGEVTPEFFGHIDDAKYQTGLALCRNFIVRPHGPVSNRPGTAFVLEVKDSTKKTVLRPFVYSTTQSMVLEIGNLYMRFHTAGATLLAPAATAWSNATAYVVGDLASLTGVVYYCILAHTNHTPPNATYWYPLPSIYYEIPTPYVEADLADLHFVQSNDVFTIVHPNYPPAELKRLGATDWTLVPISFASALAAPTGQSVAATVAGGGSLVTMSYVTSAVDSTGIEESLPSSVVTCSNNLTTAGNYNTITVGTSSGAARYNVYKLSNGLYGFIGQVDPAFSATFQDGNPIITADVSKTPPIQNLPFGSTNNYPGAVSYFQQRRDFAGTLNKPQSIWMTRTGTESNLSQSIPSHDQDAIIFKIAAREANTIRHIVPLTSLVLLTSAAEYRITSINSDALTPTSVSVTPQSYVGASNVQPVIVNNNLIFAAERGGHLRELAYAWQFSGYVTGDLSLRAPHLFDNYTILDMAYAKCPYPIVWVVSSTGSLIGLTYVPEQQIGAFHHHDTATYNDTSAFESVCVVPEGVEDAVYVVVNRTIQGNMKRYIERFGSQFFTSLAKCFFVDCGVSYNGAPITTVSSGLAHLNGEIVSILADGAVQPQQTVVAGGLPTALAVAASDIQIGLPITADIQTLPLALQIEAFSMGKMKNVNKVFLRVVNSSGIFAGPSLTKLTGYNQRSSSTTYDSPPAVRTEEIPLVITPSWGTDGSVYIRQSDPLPLILVAMTLEAAVG